MQCVAVCATGESHALSRLLRLVAVCCIVLHCVAVSRIVLQRDAVFETGESHTFLRLPQLLSDIRCSELQCVAASYSELQCVKRASDMNC